MNQTENGETIQFDIVTEYKKDRRVTAIDKIVRGGGYEIIPAKEYIFLKHTCDGGNTLELKIKPLERSVSFQIRFPFVLGNKIGKVAEELTHLNEISRNDGHFEYWSADNCGRIYLCGIIYDDGHLNEMGDLVLYAVSDFLEFAEIGMRSLNRCISSVYVPVPPTECHLNIYG